jgi:hypothetical protein
VSAPGKAHLLLDWLFDWFVLPVCEAVAGAFTRARAYKRAPGADASHERSTQDPGKQGQA